MRVDLFDFDLPEALIALRPARPRDSARLLTADRDGRITDSVVRDLPAILRPGDLLVVNDTRVIPAALKGRRAPRKEGDEGASIEALLHHRDDDQSWRAFAKPLKRLREGDRVTFSEDLDALVAERRDGDIVLRFNKSGADLDRAIAAAGVMPLPPYIAGKRAVDAQDETDYQTLFARETGAVAAPTAGLHFTPALMESLAARGVQTVSVTLHVGAGTFLPMKADDTDAHVMHGEWRVISQQTAETINQAKSEGRRIIAVGTTALRTLESSADENGVLRAVAGETHIFITPGYRFKIVDMLWTNFHLPRSTLFMLVAAFIGLECAHALYAHAIAQVYRFYSYGDACLLECAA